MERKIIKPLSGRGKEIHFQMINNNCSVIWGELKFDLEEKQLRQILKDFFI